MAIVLLGACSISALAQQPNAPQGNPAANQAQPANPFGNTEKKATDVQYATGVNNVDGSKRVIQKPANPNDPSPIMNPATAANQMGVPQTPPAGLPADAQVQLQQLQQMQQLQAQTAMQGQVRATNQSNTSQLDPVDRAINVLQAEKSKIREINRELYQKGRVINEYPVTMPKTVNDVQIAHLSPGAVSPVVRVGRNRTTAIIITDSTGQPWPIINYDGLSGEDFEVKRLDNPSPEGYVLSVTPKAVFVTGNLSVILKGLPTPLNIEFVSGQKQIDGTLQIRVQAFGPNSQYTSLGLPANLDNELLNVLQGVAPTGSKELKVDSTAVQAWLAKDGSMYVRTRYKVMAPAFDQVTSSPDGTYAYKMVPVPSVLFRAGEGRFGEFRVDGF